LANCARPAPGHALAITLASGWCPSLATTSRSDCAPGGLDRGGGPGIMAV